MNPYDQLIQFLGSTTFTPWVLVKLLFLVGLLLYVAFAVVVIRQVEMMSQTISSNFDSVLKFVTWIHLGLALCVLVLAWYIL